MKSFWLQWLLALQVLVILSILGSSILRVDASSRHLLHEGVTPVQLSEHTNSQPAPAGSMLIGESGPSELHVLLKEQVEVGEILRTYRPRPRLLSADRKKKEVVKEKSGGKKTPKGAPPPPQNSRRFVLPPPPPRSIPSCRPSPPLRK